MPIGHGVSRISKVLVFSGLLTVLPALAAQSSAHKAAEASAATTASASSRSLLAARDLHPGSISPQPAERKHLLLQALGQHTLAFTPDPSSPAKRFVANGPGFSMSLDSTGLNLVAERVEAKKQAERSVRPAAFDGGFDSGPAQNSKIKEEVSHVHVQFLGSNPAAKIEGLHPTGAKASYFIGSDPSRWQHDLPSFTQVRYDELYPGIDLVYYGGSRRKFEYDLVVKPGADPSSIRFRVDGSQHATFDKAGNLLLDGPSGQISLQRPILYQDFPSGRKAVSGTFRQIAANEYGFAIGSYDHAKPLIVDPQIKLIYSTYAGGIHDDQAYGITLDAAGNTYITGYSASQDFPVTGNALQTARKNIGTYTYDVIVMKFDPSGTLVYSTFLGGSNTEIGFTVVVDKDGNAYIGGQTLSTDFPVTAGAYQAQNGGDWDAFLAKISPDGSQLLYSTYLGGAGVEYIGKMLLNADGSLWVAGGASAAGLTPSANAFQKTPNGADNYFVAKLVFSQSGALQIPYLTFLGGSNSGENAFWGDLALDSAGNVYFGGATQSSDFPTTANALEKDATLSGGCFDSPSPNSAPVVAKFSPDLSQLLYSSEIGGQTEDQNGYPDCNNTVLSIHLDAQGNIWTVGTSGDSDLPVTSNAISKQLNGNGSAGVDDYISELSADGSKLLYSTYLGGSEFDYGARAAWDANGDIWIHGTSQSVDYPVTSDALQAANAGGYDSTITELSPDATKILYSTYLGGTSDDDYSGAGTIAIDTAGNVHLTGETGSANFPVSSYAFQPFFANGDVGADSNDIYYSVLGSGLIGVVGPVGGGNTGDTTVTITGAGFQPGASCQLSLNGVLINATKVSVSSTGTSITCTFPLNGASPGAYDVVITNPSGGGSFSKPAAFTVQSGGAPKLWVNIVSRPKIRTGVPSAVTVTYGNSGNVDAYMSHLLITMPQNIQATYNIGVPPSLASGTTVHTATTQNGLNQISLLLPRIAAGASGSFQMLITDPTDNDTYQLTAGVSKPWFTSESAAETALSAASSSYTPATSCVSEDAPTNCLNEYLTQFHTHGVTDTQTEGLAGSMLNALQQVVQYGTSPVISGSTSYSPPLATVDGTLIVDGIPSFDDTLDYHVTNVPQQNLYPTSSCVSYTGDTHDAIGASLLRCTIPVKSLVATGVFFAGGSFGETGSLIPTFDACFSAQQDIAAAGFTVNATAGTDFCDLESDTPDDDDDSQDAMDEMNGFEIMDYPPPNDFDPDPTCSGCSNGSGSSGGSIDPNGKIGPLGDGSASHFTTGSAALSYNVYFENEATASLPASQVVVTDQLDPTKVDLSTLTFGPVTFGTNVLTPPSGSNGFNKTYTPPGVTTYIVRVQGSVDTTTGLVKWTFTTLDPATNLPPSDPTVGFLPPDTDGIVGQGSAIFNIMPKSGQSTGTQVTNGAIVVFDANASISTPVWLNTLDVDPPSSAVAALPAVEIPSAGANTVTFPITWSGTDKGSGIKTYTIFVSDNGGAFTPWQSMVSTTTANYTGTTGHAYGFYSIATDGAGNIEAAKTAAEATTQVIAPGGPTATTTSLGASSTTPNVGASVTFTATVVGSGSVTPTGTVVFDDGTNVLDTATLGSSGVVTYATTSLVAGSHSITAQYSGDANNKASTSTAIAVTVTAPSYTLSANPSTISIASGGSGTTSLTLTPVGGFKQQVSFACSGLPAHATCVFAPSSLTPDGTNTASSTQLTIATNVATAELDPIDAPGTHGRGHGKPLLALLLVGAGWMAAARRRLRWSGRLGALLFFVVLAGLMLVPVGCGGASHPSTTPLGTSTVTINATSGTTSGSTLLTVTVH